jgi:hypothetical protein
MENLLQALWGKGVIFVVECAVIKGVTMFNRVVLKDFHDY